jgi:hypothetical protein
MLTFGAARDQPDDWQRRWPLSAFSIAVAKKLVGNRGPSLGVQAKVDT